MGRIWMTAAVVAATLAAGVAPVAASADEWRGGYGYEHGGYDRDGYDHDGWRARETWREREWREHRRHEYWEHAYGYAPAPVYGGYYAYPARPRVYYAPPYGY